MKLTVKYISAITISLLAFAQITNAGTSITDGASGLAPIQLTRIKGDPAIGVHQLTLPGEKPGDKDGFMRCMALSYIGAYPDILAQSNTALSVAIVFLTTEAQSRFVNDVGLPAIHRD